MDYRPRIMVVDWLNTIWKTDLPANAKYLACYLRRFMNDERDMAWPSLRKIEGETGLSHPTVLKYLNILESEGWLVKESGSFNKSNTYFAAIPEVLNECIADVGVGKQLTQGVGKEVTQGTKGGYLGVGKEVTSNKQIEINNKNSPYYPIAEMMWEHIQPITKSNKVNLDSWANDLRLLHEMDGRSVEDIKAVFIWANRDQFWRTNILSASKLRTQFPKLYAQRQAKVGSGGWRKAMGGA